MRNINQYPITHDEIISYLNELLRDEENLVETLQIVGSMRPLLLQAAIDIVKKDKDK